MDIRKFKKWSKWYPLQTLYSHCNIDKKLKQITDNWQITDNKSYDWIIELRQCIDIMNAEMDGLSAIWL